MIAYGTWKPMVDAAAVREHLLNIYSQGMSIDRISQTSGVPYATVYSIVKGLGGDRRGQQIQRVLGSTSEKLLAVTYVRHPDFQLTVADRVPLDATGTRRRIQALSTQGHSCAAQAKILGLNRDTLERIANQRQARVAKYVADAVRDLYEQLWSTPSTDVRAVWVQQRSQRLGYAPPMAWDDDTIDDPNAKPAGVDSEGVCAYTQCRLPFTPRKYNQKYCSQRCQTARWHRQAVAS